MTISKSQEAVNLNELIDSVKILVICPICSESKKLEFPKSICESTDNLTTISIPKGLICNHSFQAFVDKNYKIRGYQKVDYEFTSPSQKPSKKAPKYRKKVRSDKELFETFLAEGNYFEYYPERFKKKNSGRKDASKTNLLENEEKMAESSALDKKGGRRTQNINQQKEPSNDLPESLNPNEEILRERSLREIYEDFWEFIEDDNEDFQKFIILDDRRNKRIFDELLPSGKE